MRVQELLREAENALSAAGVENAAYDARALFAHVTGMDTATLLSRLREDTQTLFPEKREKEGCLTTEDALAPLAAAKEKPTDVITTFRRLVKQRARRVPLQHLLGTWDFMGTSFFVTEDALIPRPETELLVEKAFERLRQKKGTLRVLDIGTGTGCIALSLALLLQKDREKNNEKTRINGKLKKVESENGVGHSQAPIRITGTDISEGAMRLAERNREKLGASEAMVTFVKSDLFSNIHGRFQGIVSNPPYIPRADIQTLSPEVRDHDPLIALDGGEDGLSFYREILKEAPAYLEKDGDIFLEIGSTQANAVTAFLEKDFKDIAIYRDLAGCDRVVTGRLKGEPCSIN